MNGQKKCLGLLCVRPCLVPTWRGWLALLAAAAVSCAIAIRGAYGFLALNDPVPGGLLVVEGWSPDYTLEAALAEFRRRPYEAVFITGGPIEIGNALIEYKTYADLGTATLTRLGMPKEIIRTVPAPAVIRDRTFASAIALRQWLRDHGVTGKQINILGTGAHSRRTRLLYEKALGSDTAIGVVATREMDFDPDRWWASSQGFRIVINETIAYLYARILFSPGNEAKGLRASAGDSR